MAIGLPPKYSEEFYLEKFSTLQFLMLAVETMYKMNWKIQRICNAGFTAIPSDAENGRHRVKLIIHGEKAFLTCSSSGKTIVDFGKNRRICDDFIDVLIGFRYALSPEQLDEKYKRFREEILSVTEEGERPHFVDTPDQLKEPRVKRAPKGIWAYILPREGFYITPWLIYINLLLFAVMVSKGIGFFQPDMDSILNWGGNFRPNTLGGQWWRLFTNFFIHFGILHLLMNMYALFFIGLLLERYIGKFKFAMAYIVCGFGASVISLWWHDATLSAGASGAIFGMYGVFLALLTTNYVEKTVRKPLLISVGIFVCYNLAYGLKGNIDNAAHLGGLFTGGLVGFTFYPFLNKPELKMRNLVIGTLSGFAFLAITLLILFETPNTLGKYNRLMQTFAEIEQKAMTFYHLPPYSADSTYLQAINKDGIPNWIKCREIISEANELRDLPVALVEKNDLITRYCNYRIECYKLIARSIEQKTSLFKSPITMYNEKLDLINRKVHGEEVADSLLDIDPVFVSSGIQTGVLYIVDGKPIQFLNDIKPEDIEELSFLDSYASRKLYGDRGKNGAVIISTKKKRH